MDLTGLSVADLRALQEQINQEMKKREDQEVAKAREQILAIAQSIGIPLKDLLASSARVKAPTKSVPVRYRHPTNASLKWSGRGRQPQWVKELIGSGRSLDDLRV
jgi:DNA-binding protein H-NS